MAQPAAVGAYLPRIRVFANLRRHHRADRQVTEIRVRIVDDLVGSLRTADGTADDIAGANLARLVAVTQRPGALDDEEHLFFAAMAVERTGALPGRNNIVRVTEVLRAKRRTDARRAGFEFVA